MASQNEDFLGENGRSSGNLDNVMLWLAKHNVVPMYDKSFCRPVKPLLSIFPDTASTEVSTEWGTNHHHHFITKQDEMEYSSRFMLYSAF
jgi:hypothetical protein